MLLAKPFVLGNWKMNGLRADGGALVRELIARNAQGRRAGTLAVCPPATLLAPIGETLRGTGILLGGQDCAPEASGAHTGDISAPMLADLGCQLVIVGHSERRHNHGEADDVVQTKAAAGHEAGLTVVLCVGETHAERDVGATLAALDRQLEGSVPKGASVENLAIAYEPVWAIGSGKTPSAEDIGVAHAHMRMRIAGLMDGGEQALLLYGGSVKAANAAEIMAIDNVDGVLVGGASLDADQFDAIYSAGQGAKA
ncbi:MAG: triose-phosphate isomerase [Pseudomonadota bacterium]